MNHVVLVGRLVCDAEVVSVNDKKVTTISLAVPRNFKNSDGIYETDFIRCILWNNMAINTQHYCHQGDIIGIKGRIQTRCYEPEENERKFITEVIADKITFLSTKHTDED